MLRACNPKPSTARADSRLPRPLFRLPAGKVGPRCLGRSLLSWLPGVIFRRSHSMTQSEPRLDRLPLCAVIQPAPPARSPYATVCDGLHSRPAVVASHPNLHRVSHARQCALTRFPSNARSRCPGLAAGLARARVVRNAFAATQQQTVTPARTGEIANAKTLLPASSPPSSQRSIGLVFWTQPPIAAWLDLTRITSPSKNVTNTISPGGSP